MKGKDKFILNISVSLILFALAMVAWVSFGSGDIKIYPAIGMTCLQVLWFIKIERDRKNEKH